MIGPVSLTDRTWNPYLFADFSRVAIGRGVEDASARVATKGRGGGVHEDRCLRPEGPSTRRRRPGASAMSASNMQSGFVHSNWLMSAPPDQIPRAVRAAASPPVGAGPRPCWTRADARTSRGAPHDQPAGRATMSLRPNGSSPDSDLWIENNSITIQVMPWPASCYTVFRRDFGEARACHGQAKAAQYAGCSNGLLARSDAAPGGATARDRGGAARGRTCAAIGARFAFGLEQGVDPAAVQSPEPSLGLQECPTPGHLWRYRPRPEQRLEEAPYLQTR